ncbi:shikimate dehydrogenase [Planctomycetota bacterium]
MSPSTLIAVPLAGKDLPTVQAQTEQAVRAGAQILELRADYLLGLDVALIETVLGAIRAMIPADMPVIVTCRDPREGGQNQLSETTRLAVLQAALQAGIDFIDCELVNYRNPVVRDILDSALRDRPRARLILSSHDFNGPFADLDARYRETVAANAQAIPKLVYAARHINDCFPAFDLIHASDRDTILLCMGEAGLVSRILAKKLGAFLTFASLNTDSATAPGQLTVETLRCLYRGECLNAESEVYGVVADPVGHSKSPLIHNTCFTQQEMNRVYLPWWVAGGRDELFAFLEGLAQRPWLGVRGLSVSLPHKQAALDYVNEHQGQIEPLTEKIGATNTLLLADTQGQGLAAFNTDYAGAMNAVCTALKISEQDLRGWSVAVIGAGGVSRALVAALCQVGAEVTIYNRTLSKAQALAAAFDCKSTGLEALSSLNARLVINCTSVGMAPQVDDTPVPAATLAGVEAVFDTIYNPLETRLLREAHQQGAVCIDGLTMFVNQARAQFCLFTGQEPDTKLMRETVLKTL